MDEIGDIKWHDGWQVGKHQPLVDRQTFTQVQSLLGDKVYKSNELLYGGELMVCGHCGRPVTGESVIKKKTGKRYVYYRCSAYTSEGHPRDRMREEDVDIEVRSVLDKLRQPEAVAAWFRKVLLGSATQQLAQVRARCSNLQRQLDDTRRQQERLLNLHLSGGIDEGTFAAKNTEFRDLVATLASQLHSSERQKDGRTGQALKVFELSQSIPQTWVTADYTKKRQILNFVCSNFVLKGASVGVSTRKPFNALVEGLRVSDSGKAGIRTVTLSTTMIRGALFRLTC